jgi:glutaminase
MTPHQNHGNFWASLSQTQLHLWIAQAKISALRGQLPDYIPQLAKGDLQGFSLQMHSISGEIWAAGQTQTPFALMSVIKPLQLLYLLATLGTETVFERVGQQPSDQDYNSLAQLEQDRGWPRNPMLNSGAIALAEWLSPESPFQGCDRLCQWLNQQSGAQLFLDQQMLTSVQSRPNPTNRAMADRLAAAGSLRQPDLALATYNAICCLAGNVGDLARLGMLLAAEQGAISNDHRRIVNQLMLRCGLYQQSADVAQRVGWPIKSGVSGAVLAVIPSKGAIALYGPALDPTGNSIASLFLLEQISQALKTDLERRPRG